MAEKTEENRKTEKEAPVKDATAKSTITKKTVSKEDNTKQSEHFAVIATGGKQYVVREGDFLNIEKLDGEYKEGAEVEFTEVLMTDDGKVTKVGEPTVKGVKVIAEFIEDNRAKKISVIRFRSKSRYFKNKGHRQPYTRVKITKV